MPRGGYRKGSGKKSNWRHGKTKVIRIPEVLADRVLQYARDIDEDKAKQIDFSGVSVKNVRGKAAVFLEDLVKSGFTITPNTLMEIVEKQIEVNE